MALARRVISTGNTGRGPVLYRIYEFFLSFATGWTIVDLSAAGEFVSEATVIDGSWFVAQAPNGEQVFFGHRNSIGALAGFADATIPVGLWCVGGPSGGWDLVNNRFTPNPYSTLVAAAERFDSYCGNLDRGATLAGNTCELHMISDTDHCAGAGRISTGLYDVGWYAGRYTAFEDVADLPKAYCVLAGQPELTGGANQWDNAVGVYVPATILQAGGADWDTGYIVSPPEINTIGSSYVTAKWINDNLWLAATALARSAGILKNVKLVSSAVPYGQQNAGGTRRAGVTISLPL